MRRLFSRAMYCGSCPLKQHLVRGHTRRAAVRMLAAARAAHDDMITCTDIGRGYTRTRAQRARSPQLSRNPHRTSATRDYFIQYSATVLHWTAGRRCVRAALHVRVPPLSRLAANCSPRGTCRARRRAPPARRRPTARSAAIPATPFRAGVLATCPRYIAAQQRRAALQLCVAAT